MARALRLLISTRIDSDLCRVRQRSTPHTLRGACRLTLLTGKG